MKNFLHWTWFSHRMCFFLDNYLKATICFHLRIATENIDFVAQHSQGHSFNHSLPFHVGWIEFSKLSWISKLNCGNLQRPLDVPLTTCLVPSRTRSYLFRFFTICDFIVYSDFIGTHEQALTAGSIKYWIVTSVCVCNNTIQSIVLMMMLMMNDDTDGKR